MVMTYRSRGPTHEAWGRSSFRKRQLPSCYNNQVVAAMDSPVLPPSHLASHNPHDGEHELRHPPSLLGARASSDDKDKPWHTISVAEFAAMHRAHALAHTPDGVLFPFLDGLEGDNVAQNTFFSSGGA
ncbi:hypothetical protein DFH08DRAFT_938571 [Mycena albidolilacea]|uniref:Uncharacterized protein n=1 Tax=Mycena albidolilacea TaxID=1033008 RepID=A0AAD6ZUY4_9AGAR|nr:hypothetical protein DFH08DRAFT_938571 [Mycena albidolilacea]